MYVCLYVCLNVCLSEFLSVCVSVCLSISLSICLSVCLVFLFRDSIIDLLLLLSMCPCMSISFFSRSRLFPSACACVYACLCDCYNCSYLYACVPPFNSIFDVVSFKSVSIYLGAVENQRELCGQSIGHSILSSLYHVHQYLHLLHLKKTN